MNKYIAEAMGTFCHVYAGRGAMVAADVYPGTLGHLGIGMVWGLIVMAMIYSLGNISGAHINPAVTIGFCASGRFDKKELLPYVSCQVGGAIAAAALLRYLYPEHATLGATLPQADYMRVFVMEVMLSFILMFVILNVSTGHMEKGIMAGVAVGGTVAIEALMGGPMTGASMNPARSLGPALVSGNMTGLWLYIVAPILGCLLAQPTCQWIQGRDCCPDES